MTDLVPELLIELDPPIQLHNAKYETVQLREPTAADVIRALKDAGNGMDSSHNMIMSLIVSVSGLQKQVVEKMGIRQFQTAGEYLMSFINGGPSTTEN